LNGEHVELFTYALYLNLNTPDKLKQLSPLRPIYHFVNKTDAEPHLILKFGKATFTVEISANDHLLIYVLQSELQTLPDVNSTLKENDFNFVYEWRFQGASATRG